MGRKEEKKRNLTLDFARGFAILLMIYDHIIGHGKVITSFHMPLFFIISGYLLKDQPFRQTLKKKAKGLLLPYLEFAGLAILGGFFKAIFILHANWQATGKYLFHKMVDTLCARDIWLLWFLLALFEALMIYVGIKCLTKNRYMQIILVLLVFVLGYCLSQKYGSANFYYLDQGMMAVLFVAVGDAAKKLSREKLYRFSWMRMGILAMMLVIWMLGICFGLLVMANRVYEGFPLCIFSAIAGTYLVVFCSHFMKRIPLLGSMIVWCGQNTLEILCLANIFRQFSDWKALCQGLGIHSIFVMSLLQTGLIVGIVLVWKIIIKHTRKLDERQ